jgi:MFS family permease
MTVGRGNFGTINLALLVLAAVSVILFIRIEARTTTPLIKMVMFRNQVLTSSLIMSALVATVMMATLVVGPFYLARALELETALVGLAMSVGPVVATFSGVPVGRTTDRFGAQRITIAGLVLMLFGTLAIAAIPTNFGVPGYLAPLVITTVGYMLFQTANNTAIMTKLHADQRGVISGMLSLSRNLGLIMGASLMGAIFAFASATTDVTSAPPDAVASGMRVTFFVAGTLIAIALAIALQKPSRH